MSAEGMKRAAMAKIDTARKERMTSMAERTGDDYGEMKLTQGIIEGLRQALFYTEEAYKELG